MRKKTQLFINETVGNVWAEYLTERTQSDAIIEKRLRSCSAHIQYYEDIDGNRFRFIALRSYSTIVAIFDTETNTLYDALRMVYGYTSTSAQHIAKFRSDLRHELKLGWNDITELRYYPV